MKPDIKKKLDAFFLPKSALKFKKGTILINAEENPEVVYYLISGVVKRYAISENGEELVLNTYKPNSFFPVSVALNNTPNKHYYEALTEVELKKAPGQEVVGFLKSEPEVVLDLLSRIYSGLEGLFSRMVYLMSGSAEKRLILELVITAKRFGVDQGKETLISLKLTEKDLAAQTGIARETVSRLFRTLKDQDLVRFSRSTLTIKNLKKLEEKLLLI